MENLLSISKVLLLTLLLSPSSLVDGTYVNPATFLDSRLSKGSWISGKDVIFAEKLFEGGWVWSESGSLEVTHICRAKINNFPDVRIEPGELLNGTCYVAGVPTLSSLTGVREFKEYEVLMKLEDEVYEWVPFDKNTGNIPHGTVIGGIGSSYEPILLCRKFYNGTAGNLRASKAVLGKFSPKDGKCFYELEFGSSWVKWDLSFQTEDFQLLILRARGAPQCAEPRGPELKRENSSKSIKNDEESISLKRVPRIPIRRQNNNANSGSIKL